VDADNLQGIGGTGEAPTKRVCPFSGGRAGTPRLQAGSDDAQRALYGAREMRLERRLRGRRVARTHGFEDREMLVEGADGDRRRMAVMPVQPHKPHEILRLTISGIGERIGKGADDPGMEVPVQGLDGADLLALELPAVDDGDGLTMRVDQCVDLAERRGLGEGAHGRPLQDHAQLIAVPQQFEIGLADLDPRTRMDPEQALRRELAQGVAQRAHGYVQPARQIRLRKHRAGLDRAAEQGLAEAPHGDIAQPELIASARARRTLRIALRIEGGHQSGQRAGEN